MGAKEKQVKAKDKDRMNELFAEKYGEFFLPGVHEVAVEDVIFDPEAVEAQVQVLDDSVVKERVASLRTVEPDDLIDVRLLEKDLSGMLLAGCWTGGLTSLSVHRQQEDHHQRPAHPEGDHDPEAGGPLQRQGAAALAGAGQGQDPQGGHPAAPPPAGRRRLAVPATGVRGPEAVGLGEAAPGAGRQAAQRLREEDRPGDQEMWVRAAGDAGMQTPPTESLN